MSDDKPVCVYAFIGIDGICAMSDDKPVCVYAFIGIDGICAIASGGVLLIATTTYAGVSHLKY